MVTQEIRIKLDFIDHWQGMKNRCTNSNNRQWKDYGGRGITVYYEWLKFENFNKDMRKTWKSGLTIERKNNEKGYCLENCYWATRKQQQRNTRRNHLVKCFGKIQCIIEWSEETGIPAKIIRWRLKYGWSPRKALTTPVGKYEKRSK